ncbi:prepilin-type N-terminal cleavage/methylation domain-containing protein [Patescibacteria group bacterium]|nr:prepilin-type N-terminal cleavage/methylation domain-containing protein [Patescibacteria group bacterium]
MTLRNHRQTHAAHQRGFTIIELTLVIGLIAVVSLILMNIFITHGRIFRGELSEVELQLEGARAVENITAAARVADQVVTSRTINGTSYTTSFNTLILAMPSIDGQGTISGSWDYIVFYLDSQDASQLRLSQEADPSSNRSSHEKLLSDSVSQLTFLYDDGTDANVQNIELDATLTETVFDVTHSVDIHTRFHLSNQ